MSLASYAQPNDEMKGFSRFFCGRVWAYRGPLLAEALLLNFGDRVAGAGATSSPSRFSPMTCWCGAMSICSPRWPWEALAADRLQQPAATDSGQT